MRLLFKKDTAILELMQTVSRQYSDVLRRRERYRVRNDASTGQSVGSAFMHKEMCSLLFKFFYFRYLNCTN